VILRVEDDSRWREGVGGCNPCRRLVEKWLENHHRRAAAAGQVGPWEKVLNLLWVKQKLSKINTWLRINPQNLLSTKYN